MARNGRWVIFSNRETVFHREFVPDAPGSCLVLRDVLTKFAQNCDTDQDTLQVVEKPEDYYLTC